MNKYKFSDIHLSLAHTFKTTITKDMMQKFSGYSGDTNPLHLDPKFAAEQGHPNTVVFGMLTASFYSTLVGVYLPGKYALLHSIDITFNLPVYPGEQLTVSGEVKHIHEPYRQVEIKASIQNQTGKKVSKAKIKVGLNR
jgi:3-hydroxybutyryl-CoA dehydratase